jgi:circadian clock protein KaiC
MTRKPSKVTRIETGIPNLDALFCGGIPQGSVVVVGGPAGSGKTTLCQQICFHIGTPDDRVLYFSTLSEPTAKTLRYLSQFSFFDREKLEHAVTFIDLGVILRGQGLEQASKLIMEQIKAIKPSVVVIDSFKAFDDLAESFQALRKFDYELAVNLMAWETTTFLLGEYSPRDIGTNPLFSIVDGLIMVSQREQSGEQQRFIQAVKMRGTDHSREEHTFVIGLDGVEVFAPRVTIQREDRGGGGERCRTGITKLDDLLADGIPIGSSLLVSGVAGTGKTILLLEFLYRGALAGEKGIIFSFEESKERLLATARGLGWDVQGEIDRGMLEIVFIPQPAIMVEAHLLMMRQRVEALGAQRIAVDSLSVFLHKVEDPQINREKIFQLASIVQNSRAVGLFAADIPYGQNQISRFGVEETTVDGVILLTSTEEGLERQRYLEVYKLRNTAHLKGRHNMVVGPGGITIFPRYRSEAEALDAPRPPASSSRLPTGVEGLDALFGGGLLERSVTLVSGSAGIGKTTLGLQFLLEGARREEPGLYLALEEGPAQLLETAASIGLPLAEALAAGRCEVIHVSPERARAGHFLALLDDKIRAQQTKRLVIDSVSHMVQPNVAPAELRELLYALVVRFKAHGVTSLFTLESDSLTASDTVTGREYSPVADNILLLRYARRRGRLHPTLAVVKTRGSAHVWDRHDFTIGQGGIRIEQLADDDTTRRLSAGRGR